MLSQRRRVMVSISAIFIALLGALVWVNAKGQRMSEVKFELGKNIIETAKASGVPRFATRDVNGYISYSVTDAPREVDFRYTKPGYEISWRPVFAFTMYADRKRDEAMPVDTTVLQLNIDAMDDLQAQAFVESTIAQFQKGKWQRYRNPQEDVLLTGRSSYLDEAGDIEWGANTIDPNYKIPKEDWIKLSGSAIWRWVGDGVLAQLTVNNSPGQAEKPAYRMTLEFDLLNVKLKQDAANLARELKEGDAKGWGSTARHESEQKALFEKLKRMETNAIKRGDAVHVPQSNR